MRKELWISLVIVSILLISGSTVADDEGTLSIDLYEQKTCIDHFPTRDAPDGNLTIEFKDPKYEVKANQLALPINLSEVQGLQNLIGYTDINSSEIDYLSNHGYVNAGDSRYHDLVDLYDLLNDCRFPLYVTTDSMLHLYHVLFDELLRTIEEGHLMDLMMNFTGSVLSQATKAASSYSGKLNVSHLYETVTIKGPVAYLINESLDIKEIAAKNVIYLSVALRLLDPTATIPSWAENLVKMELDLINSHNKLALSPLMDRSDVHPVLTYMEDYTQYRPRGHYTRSTQLERYFKVMMWFGQITMRQKSAEETMQAVLLADAVSKAFHSTVPSTDLWNETYAITSFFVGWSDDLTYGDYCTLTSWIYGRVGPSNSKMKDPSRLLLLMDYLDELRKPKINSHYYNVFMEGMENATLGMRMMGQRLVPDSYMFQQLVGRNTGPYTGTGTPFTLSHMEDLGYIRGFPRGMDAMAVLGFDIAETYLIQGGDTRYVNYSSQFGKLRAEFQSIDNGTWGSNLYWGWLHTLGSLNENFTRGQYPTFMRSNGYLAEKLNTALGSWTELRHDTILYAKQSHPGVGCSADPEGYVEPIPAFYSRLRTLTNATRDGLKHLEVLTNTMKGNLQNLSNILLRLEDISKKELENVTITRSDYIFIDRFDMHIQTVLVGVPRESGDSRMIVDVHTDFNEDPTDQISGKCLEEAVGNFDLIIVIQNGSDGKLRAAIGPVFSYYEFKRPISDRMTDDDWKIGLQTGMYDRHKFDWMEYPQTLQKITSDATTYSDLSVTHKDILMTYTEVPEVEFRVSASIDVRNKGCVRSDVTVKTFLGSTDESDLLSTRKVDIGPFGSARIFENWTVQKPTAMVEMIFVTLDADPSKDMNPYNNEAMKFIELKVNQDYDGDGILNHHDAFPFDPAASLDTDGDGYPDRWNPGMGPEDSTIGLEIDAFPLDPLEWSDLDSDGYGDNSDEFPLDPSEWSDLDLDGIGDNSDMFPEDPAASIDTDGDGYPDDWNPGMGPEDSTTGLSIDDLPEDPLEWSDTDGDGYGDNSDMFPGDPTEWVDTDGDGCGDNSDHFPLDPEEWIDRDDDGVGDNSDDFPDDPSEWKDTDHDGYGDNSDAFPENPAEWSDRDGDGYGDNQDDLPDDPTGWKDSDKDGYHDGIDEYPYDPNEWKDRDGDGCGDNQDRFPDDPDEWSDIDSDGVGDFSDVFPYDPDEWADSDNDGTGDNSDAFPLDPAASVDSDGDGYPDRWNPGKTENDSTTGLKLDMYPDDEDRFEEPSYSFKFIRWLVLGALILIAMMISAAIVIFRSRSNTVSKRILRYKRNMLLGAPEEHSMMTNEEIAIEVERRRSIGDLPDDICSDIIDEFGTGDQDEH
ncbi:MAG: DUF3160 domain-containing protein [Thermoplasmatota archaeon]